ncbi:hypothetical protein Aspvir_005985 [Aspergillus viridinutans]|uniref:Uncharacterized protein n=1 Tax=Aspergillus viridinutans TaxID=75553 RepID=A0A9P3C0R7_ASPVI|nr:uncharacterized protein Aspvir_005985 [Aspergillus viridinutans]GIK01944.1 hypothetical protein Aspvir_005985 [Aspergillus viridinutans]
MLRVQNTYAERKVQMRVEKVLRMKRREQLARRTAIAIIPPRVHIATEVHSWNHFCSDYAINSGITFFNLLPGFYTNSSSTCCQEALHAVSLASLALKLRQSGLMAQARRHYGKAIIALNVTLNDPVLTADDSVLVTLLLFSLFETIVPDYLDTTLPDTEFQCHIHFRGALMLLRWRAEQGRRCELDRRVFAFFSHICLMSMFVDHGLHDAKWSSLEKFTAPWIKDPLLEPILGRSVHFKRRAQAQITARGDQAYRLEVLPQLIRDGISVSEGLEATAISVRSSSDPNLPSGQQPTAFNHMFEVSNKTTEAIVRSLYRAVRYHVVELVLDLIARMKEEVDTTSHEFNGQVYVSERLVMILEQICGDICAVLNFDSKHHIEEDKVGMAHRAFGMFFPMVVPLFSSLAGEEKRGWLREKLRLIGESTGFGLATLAAQMINPIDS